MNNSLYILAALVSSVSTGCSDLHNSQEQPAVSFAVVADIQYADRDPVPEHGCYYRCSLPKLREAVNYFNSRKPDFAIQLGDYVDCYLESFETVNNIWNRIEVPKYGVIGNHDYLDAEVEKEVVLEKLGMDKPYYSFNYSEFEFIVLDTYDVSVYAGSADSAAVKKARRMLEEQQEKGHSNAEVWNSAVSDEQLAWLDTRLGRAEKEGKKIIVFGHHPAMPFNGNNTLWNGKELADLLSEYPNVVLYLSGHLHAGNHFQYKGVEHISLESILGKPPDNAYAVVEIYQDRLEINGFGGMTPENCTIAN